MPYYRRVGDIPRKRHTLHRSNGAVIAEELVGTEGFAGASALLYHRHSPSAIVRIESVDEPALCWHANRPLRPHHLRTPALAADARSTDAVRGRQPLLGNDDVRISWVRADTTSPLYRDATGDELVYVHEGAAVLESVFGTLPVAGGDYVVVPAGVTHRWVVDLAGRAARVRSARPRLDPGALRERGGSAPRRRALQRARRARARTPNRCWSRARKYP